MDGMGLGWAVVWSSSGELLLVLMVLGGAVLFWGGLCTYQWWWGWGWMRVCVRFYLSFSERAIMK
jgi:hypothetical protein